jgi:hypothetical protein
MFSPSDFIEFFWFRVDLSLKFPLDQQIERVQLLMAGLLRTVLDNSWSLRRGNYNTRPDLVLLLEAVSVIVRLKMKLHQVALLSSLLGLMRTTFLYKWVQPRFVLGVLIGLVERFSVYFTFLVRNEQIVIIVFPELTVIGMVLAGCTGIFIVSQVPIVWLFWVAAFKYVLTLSVLL